MLLKDGVSRIEFRDHPPPIEDNVQYSIYTMFSRSTISIKTGDLNRDGPWSSLEVIYFTLSMITNFKKVSY